MVQEEVIPVTLTAAIGRNGRQFVNYISNQAARVVAYSDNGTTGPQRQLDPILDHGR